MVMALIATLCMVLPQGMQVANQSSVQRPQVLAQSIEGVQAPISLNAAHNGQMKITLVGHRFVDQISGLVRDKDGNNFGSWSAAPGSRLLVVKLRIEKPRGSRFELHQNDYSLVYRDVSQEGWDDRSKATAFRILDDDVGLWTISPTGYAARRAPDLDESSEVYVELGFQIEDGVREVALQVARPVLAIQLGAPVRLGSTRF
jgi:hypothetical protein